MHFTKMHGLGNDYLYVYGEVPGNIAEISQKLSDRHFGAGSDGMIYISPSSEADFAMRIFNADGSEAMMCGNGIRCVGKYLYDKGYTDRKSLKIETLSGIKTLTLFVTDGKVDAVSVDMGKTVVGKRMSLSAEGRAFDIIPVNVGNPHAVIFVDDIDETPLEKYGPLIEKNNAFPGGVNVEFVKKTGENEFRVRVWERGSGITMACGTGSCAVASAAVSEKLCGSGSPVCINLDGGSLSVKVNEDFSVVMTGPAQTVYEGEVSI